jgi:hypothetical protein
MKRRKCARCGLVNFATDQACRRCGFVFEEDGDAASSFEIDDSVPKKRSLWKRLLWILGMSFTILFICYASLLLSSDPLDFDQRQAVYRATEVLDQKGFGKEAFVLRHLVSFRRTDNWWNMQVGHREAYAATNFPFEVVTLYPEFFDVATDDYERAVILLHESYHLFGSGEVAALEGVWRDKRRLGWTEDKYGQTQVWRNTREMTLSQVPHLFRCGTDGKSDCTQ